MAKEIITNELYKLKELNTYYKIKVIAVGYIVHGYPVIICKSHNEIFAIYFDTSGYIVTLKNEEILEFSDLMTSLCEINKELKINELNEFNFKSNIIKRQSKTAYFNFTPEITSIFLNDSVKIKFPKAYLKNLFN